MVKQVVNYVIVKKRNTSVARQQYAKDIHLFSLGGSSSFFFCWDWKFGNESYYNLQNYDVNSRYK